MILVAEMKKGGVFEAETKRELTKSMIKYYSSNDCGVDQIKSIFCIYNDERTNELCRLAIGKIQDIVEEGVENEKKQAKEGYEGEMANHSDYLANLI